jgi:hypothetical protein
MANSPGAGRTALVMTWKNGASHDGWPCPAAWIMDRYWSRNPGSHFRVASMPQITPNSRRTIH